MLGDVQHDEDRARDAQSAAEEIVELRADQGLAEEVPHARLPAGLPIHLEHDLEQVGDRARVVLGHGAAREEARGHHLAGG